MQKFEICNIWAAKLFRYLPLVGVASLLFAGNSSCTSSKQLAYFQKGASDKDTVAIMVPYVSTVRKGDILSIQISSLNPEASSFFNPPSVSTVGYSTPTVQANSLPQATGYLVSDAGTIQLPILGELNVVGKTNRQISEMIKGRLGGYLKEPTVNVRNLNFRVSVLGEVAHPAVYNIPNEQLTLPEALGLAGDLTIYGRRNNVLIIREEDNKRIFAHVDLTRRDAFRSPYYSLHSNDIVYVEPGKYRVTNADRTFLFLPTIVSALSAIAILINRW
ncbi:polysaccharide export protein [Spirosoma taeanense]|uniref:Polysaccharide export protein n=1 Tax=Spirosoma taeanense TaxID=2735870 RepID=A0A6M5Y3P2_9BACT|nr:polysaccharide biosynthesis/export family protein [Spirosoma taeanense]QJW87994.1 polysaccharide export protein [Spirosoma taeanense]